MIYTLCGIGWMSIAMIYFICTIFGNKQDEIRNLMWCITAMVIAIWFCIMGK